MACSFARAAASSSFNPIQSVFKQRIGEFEDMNILPKTLRSSLSNKFGSSFCAAQPVMKSASQQVNKVLLALPDKEPIEAVALRYKRGWESFCISSQCGCGFGCTFCATGAKGFTCNLTAKEITDQILYFYLTGHTLDRVSFMGMGEPLSNPSVFDVLRLLTDPAHFGMSQRKITVSIVGILPGIQRMTREFPQINLAFSLHSPFEKQRSHLMPVNQKYPLNKVMGVLDEHIKKTGHKVFIAYMLVDGVNDTAEHGRAVAALLKSKTTCTHLYHVDLIRYNQTDKVNQAFRRPSLQKIKTFSDLLKAEGINVTIRTQFGSDIDAACGQLYGEK